MRRIKLTGEKGEGKFTLVDDEDYPLAQGFKWYAHSRRGKLYATTNIYDRKTKKQKTTSLHHAILWTPKGTVIDHINGNTFDNRRANLRICSQTENNQNSRARKDNTSGSRGVHQQRGRWLARIGWKGTRYFLGSFLTKKEADRAYNEKAQELYGINAKLN